MIYRVESKNPSSKEWHVVDMLNNKWSGWDSDSDFSLSEMQRTLRPTSEEEFLERKKKVGQKVTFLGNTIEEAIKNHPEYFI